VSITVSLQVVSCVVVGEVCRAWSHGVNALFSANVPQLHKSKSQYRVQTTAQPLMCLRLYICWRATVM